jgi:hypothetical protein
MRKEAQPMQTEFTDMQDRMARLLEKALELGGEPLALKVDTAMAVAYRHCSRIESGILQPSPAVLAEMAAACDRAQEVLDVASGTKEKE